jgi:predicted deacylase
VHSEDLEQVMEGWGYRFIQYVDGIALTSAGPSPTAGVASVEIEGGSAGDVKAAEIDIMYAGIIRGLRNFGVLAGPKESTPENIIRVDVGEENQYTALADGIVEHEVELGAEIHKGQIVALLHPASGASAKPIEICAPGARCVVRQKSRALVRKGELIGSTGTARA